MARGLAPPPAPPAPLPDERVAAAARQLFGSRKAPDGSLVAENFLRWAGGSQMSTQVFYHGTQYDFDRFRVGEHGIFVAANPAMAESFSRLNPRLPAGYIMPVFLAIARPWKLISYGEEMPYSQMIDQSRETLIEAGYDGMYRPGDGVLIAFHAANVKSAIGNSGAFDRESDDLTDAHAWAEVESDAPRERERVCA